MVDTFLLTLSCINQPGIVACVTSELFRHGGSILEAHQFDDAETGRFFTRIAFNVPAGADVGVDRCRAPIATRYDMDWTIRPRGERREVLPLVFRFDHCLVELIYRWRIGELPMDVVGIIANHPCDGHGALPADVLFRHLLVMRDTKPQREARIKAIMEETDAELIVLARHMQILSDDLAAFLSGRCINVHHGFLPGFKGGALPSGARARREADWRARYVTADLDERPIIEQDVERISHHDAAEDLIRKGRDIERRTLARAVAPHLDGRAFLNGAKIVVFRD